MTEVLISGGFMGGFRHDADYARESGVPALLVAQVRAEQHYHLAENQELVSCPCGLSLEHEGVRFQFTWRAWGDLMARAAERDDYLVWYMDEPSYAPELRRRPP
jgi:hypothetical protein